MFTAIRRLFGSGSARKQVSWYRGAPAMEQLIEDFLASAAATKADVAAGAIARRMCSEGEGAVVLGELASLMQQGSRLATYLWAAHMQSSADAGDHSHAEEQLHALAEQGFQLAMFRLYGSWTVDTLIADTSKARMKALAACARQGSVFCTLLLGEAIRRYPALCTDEEGRATVAGWLYDAACKGSWDALRLLIAMHASRVPGVFELDHRRETLNMLRTAAGQGLCEAMVLLANVHLDNVLAVRDTAVAETWLQKAADAGSTDGKSTLAQLLLQSAGTAQTEGERSELLARAASLIEEGCAQEHVPSLLARAEYLRLQDPADAGRPEPGKEVLQLLHRAAELGDASMYLDALFTLLEKADAAGQKEICALLDEPCVRDEPARIVNLALWKLRRCSGTAEADALLEAVRACATFPGYGPACACLVEISAMGMYGQKVDLQEATAWSVRGIGLRNQRCLSLMCLLRLGFFGEQVLGPASGSTAGATAPSEEQASQDAAHTALLQTLADWGERIAAVHQFGRQFLLDREDAYECLCRDMKTDSLAEVTASVSSVIAGWTTEALQRRDYGFCCFLAAELHRAAPGRLNEELARALTKAPGLEVLRVQNTETVSLNELACALRVLMQERHILAPSAQPSA